MNAKTGACGWRRGERTGRKCMPLNHIYKFEKVQAGTCCCLRLPELWKHAAWPMDTRAQVQLQMLPTVPQSAIDQATEFAIQILIVPHLSLLLLNVGSCCMSSTHSSSSLLLSEGRRDWGLRILFPFSAFTVCNCLISTEIQIRRK